MHQEVQTLFIPRKPRAVILGRGAGGALQAASGLLDITCVVDSDWKTFDCIRSNGGAGDVKLVRQPLDHQICQQILAEAKPEVLVGNACCKTDDLGLGGVTHRNAGAIVQLFIASRAQVW